MGRHGKEDFTKDGQPIPPQQPPNPKPSPIPPPPDPNKHDR